MKIAVIPARGGSKRIPRKNIKPFCGKPMIAWSIEAAQQSGLFDRVVVSTDDEEIAARRPRIRRHHAVHPPAGIGRRLHRHQRRRHALGTLA